jgi:hypothetical protein
MLRAGDDVLIWMRRWPRGCLRYFARHRDDSAANRDKTDLVATFPLSSPSRGGPVGAARLRVGRIHPAFAAGDRVCSRSCPSPTFPELPEAGRAAIARVYVRCSSRPAAFRISRNSYGLGHRFPGSGAEGGAGRVDLSSGSSGDARSVQRGVRRSLPIALFAAADPRDQGFRAASWNKLGGSILTSASDGVESHGRARGRLGRGSRLLQVDYFGGPGKIPPRLAAEEESWSAGRRSAAPRPRARPPAA